MINHCFVFFKGFTKLMKSTYLSILGTSYRPSTIGESVLAPTAIVTK